MRSRLWSPWISVTEKCCRRFQLSLSIASIGPVLYRKLSWRTSVWKLNS